MPTSVAEAAAEALKTFALMVPECPLFMLNAPKIARGLMGHVGALLAGAFSAFILVLALSYSDTPLLFLAYVSGLPLFVAGLGAGALASLLAAYAGSASLMLIVPSNITVLYIFLFGFPAVVLTAMAMRRRVGGDGKTYWYPVGYIAALLPVYASILFAIVAGLAHGEEEGLLGMSRHMLQALWDQPERLDRLREAKIDPVIIKEGIEQLAFFIPAVCSAAWITVTLGGMMAAQRIVKAQGWNLRDGFDFEEFRLPAWLGYVVAGLAVATAATSGIRHYYAYNLVMIFGLPCILTGLAVVHFMAKRSRAKTPLLVIFYLALMILPWIGLLVVLVGLADHWADFRKRWNAKHLNGTA